MELLFKPMSFRVPLEETSLALSIGHVRAQMLNAG